VKVFFKYFIVSDSFLKSGINSLDFGRYGCFAGMKEPNLFTDRTWTIGISKMRERFLIKKIMLLNVQSAFLSNLSKRLNVKSDFNINGSIVNPLKLSLLHE